MAKKRYRVYEIATIQEPYTYYVDEPVYSTRHRWRCSQGGQWSAWDKAYYAHMREDLRTWRGYIEITQSYAIESKIYRHVNFKRTGDVFNDPREIVSLGSSFSAASEYDSIPVGGSVFYHASSEPSDRDGTKNSLFWMVHEVRRESDGVSKRYTFFHGVKEEYQVQTGTRKVPRQGHRPKQTKGRLLYHLTAEDGEYPDNGAKGNNWYEKVDYTLQLTGETNIGSKTGDFWIEVNAQGISGEIRGTLSAEIGNSYLPIYRETLTESGTHLIPVKAKHYESLRYGESTRVLITLSDDVQRVSLTVTFSRGNTAPTITAISPIELGTKNDSFEVQYRIEDAESRIGGNAKVTETLNGKPIHMRKSNPKRTVPYGSTLSLPILNEDLAGLIVGQQNTIEVVAEDEQGATSRKQWFFTRSNTAPTVSGSDTDLGTKNDAFSVTYTVNDTDTANTLKVTETLNQVPIRTVSNMSRNQEQRITIDRTKLLALPLNARNTLEVKVEDGAGGVAYRRWTFTRSNSAPTISGSDGDLGSKTAPFSISFTPTDAERDAMTAILYLDDKILKEFKTVQSGVAQSYTFDKMSFAEVEPNTPHRLRFVVRDVHGAEATQTKTFTRALSELSYVFKKNTDQRVTKAIVTPTWHLGTGAIGKVEVCNNANDSSPRWEVMTTQALEGRHFNLTNTSKTASTWAFGVRVTITKGQAKSWLGGFGGAYQ